VPGRRNADDVLKCYVSELSGSPYSYWQALIAQEMQLAVEQQPGLGGRVDDERASLSTASRRCIKGVMAWHKQGESYLGVCEGSVSKREMIGKSCSRLAGRE